MLHAASCCSLQGCSRGGVAAAAATAYACAPSPHYCTTAMLALPALFCASTARQQLCWQPLCFLQGKLLASDSFPGQDRNKLCLASKVRGLGGPSLLVQQLGLNGRALLQRGRRLSCKS